MQQKKNEQCSVTDYIHCDRKFGSLYAARAFYFSVCIAYGIFRSILILLLSSWY